MSPAVEALPDMLVRWELEVGRPPASIRPSRQDIEFLLALIFETGPMSAPDFSVIGSA